MAKSKKQAAGSAHAEPTARTPFPKGLAQPALRALASAGDQHLEQLSDRDRSLLVFASRVWPERPRQAPSALQEMGLSFATTDVETTASIPDDFIDLWSDDAEIQGKAFQQILARTSEKVDWAYAAWDDLLKRLTDRNNHSRSIAAQVLCNLAKSDPSQRMLRDFPRRLRSRRG